MVPLIAHAVTQEVSQLVIAGEVDDCGRNRHHPSNRNTPMSIQRKQLVHELQMCVIFKDSELFLFAGLSGYPLKSTDPKKDYLQST